MLIRYAFIFFFLMCCPQLVDATKVVYVMSGQLHVETIDPSRPIAQYDGAYFQVSQAIDDLASPTFLSDTEYVGTAIGDPVARILLADGSIQSLLYSSSTEPQLRVNDLGSVLSVSLNGFPGIFCIPGQDCTTTAGQLRLPAFFNYAGEFDDSIWPIIQPSSRPELHTYWSTFPFPGEPLEWEVKTSDLYWTSFRATSPTEDSLSTSQWFELAAWGMQLAGELTAFGGALASATVTGIGVGIPQLYGFTQSFTGQEIVSVRSAENDTFAGKAGLTGSVPPGISVGTPNGEEISSEQSFAGNGFYIESTAGIFQQQMAIVLILDPLEGDYRVSASAGPDSDLSINLLSFSDMEIGSELNYLAEETTILAGDTESFTVFTPDIIFLNQFEVR